MNDQTGDESLTPDDAAMIAESMRQQWPPPDRAASLKARILAGVRAEAAGEAAPATGVEGRAPATPDAAPSAGAAFLTVHAKDRVWVPVGPGVEMCTLLDEADRRSILLRMQPGSFLPPHHHRLAEESLILEGDAWIGRETYLTAGDYHYSGAGENHPLLESPQGCIVYVRCERRFRPRVTPGLIKRLLQGVVGRSPG